MSTQPPGYVEIPTLYDETHRGKWALMPDISSMGNNANLIGYLEHHDPSTDGSFAICLAGGSGNFVSKALYDSIPEAHRPTLNTDEDVDVSFSLLGSTQKALGSVIMPLILINYETNTRFRIKLHALVMPRLLMGMFIGTTTAKPFLRTTQYLPGNGCIWGFEFRKGEVTQVEFQG
ncbi:hypothetical protein NLJ89_g5108 [Agrocybe chaxingu]|uniref:Uncharacterized protein n=1 Tax=Agrocybe chaxingu TaxID=84603 RepID=A0A9W8JZ63_9AGAR|nr:hypothetical protein NLJ89_g5108 [Agrocybe chaxingu]